MKKAIKIELPKGCFEGNCSDCVYANWYDKDNYGQVKCQGPYGGYNNPDKRNGCIHYKKIR